MKREWNTEELAEHWTLRPEETALLANKSGATRLGFAALLKFFQYEHRFPRQRQDIPVVVIEYLAPQVEVLPTEWTQYDWKGRTIKYHRAQIRELLGFREATGEDTEALGRWLVEHTLSRERNHERIFAELMERCRELRIEPPAPEQIDRLIRDSINSFEKQFCAATIERLPADTRLRLDVLLQHEASEDGEDLPQEELRRTMLAGLLADAGAVSLDNLLEQIDKLSFLRSLSISADLFQALSPKIVEAYRQRVAVESPFELRRHARPLRLTLLAAFAFLRQRELTDTLVDLLLATVHRIASKAERRVQKEFLDDLKRVTGKNSLLFQMADASLSQPDGVVKDVVFPVAGEETLRNLVAEWKATGKSYRNHVQTVICHSYRSYYRRMLPKLLSVLEFRSNNEKHRPVLQAIGILRKYANSKASTYPLHEDVPLDGVVRAHWQHAVIERDKSGNERANRISYEVCVLQALRAQLRCKAIWVVGADRYRNPDEDLPADFDEQKSAYYEALKLPGDPETFIAGIQKEMKDALSAFDRSILKNPHVKIITRGSGHIKVSKLEPQAEPENILTTTPAHSTKLRSRDNCVYPHGRVSSIPSWI